MSAPHHIACFGEVVWDDFPDGKRPGGSPGNYAFHCQKLANQVSFISRVGMDEDGDELIEFLSSKGLPVQLVQKDAIYPTGKVLVHGPPDAPYYTIVENTAWDFIEHESEIGLALESADAFCFATLTQRSEKSSNSLNSILSQLNPSVLKVVDINLRPPFYSEKIILSSIENANLVKLNAEEYEIVSELLDQADLLQWMIESKGVKWVCITKGHEGASLSDGSRWWKQDAYLNESASGDTVGVGDAFLAALTTSFLNKMDVQDALDLASRYASEVAGHKGAMPDFTWHYPR